MIGRKRLDDLSCVPEDSTAWLLAPHDHEGAQDTHRECCWFDTSCLRFASAS